MRVTQSAYTFSKRGQLDLFSLSDTNHRIKLALYCLDPPFDILGVKWRGKQLDMASTINVVNSILLTQP